VGHPSGKRQRYTCNNKSESQAENSNLRMGSWAIEQIRPVSPPARRPPARPPAAGGVVQWVRSGHKSNVNKTKNF